MAYDATFQDDEKQLEQPGGNPYAQLAKPAEPAYSPVSLPGTEALPGTQGPSATGHVNFDQLYSANAGVAGREAAKLQTSAQQKAEGAKAGLTGAQGQFAQGLRTGANAGPSTADYGYATGSTKVRQPAGLAPPPKGAQLPGASTQSEGEWRAGLEAGAKRGYEGPNALSGMDAYAKLAQDTAAAQDEANALAGGNAGLQAQGLNRTDAALLGAAGRKGFDELGQRYGGLKGELDKANAESQDQAKARRAADDEGQGLYEQLLSDYDARLGGEADARQKDADARKATADKIAKDAADRARFIEYRGGGSDLDHARNTLHDVGKNLDPTEWFTGNSGITTRGTNALSPMSSTNTGNVWSGWTDKDYDVWGSMSDSDWAQFADLSDAEKHAWINARRAKLNGGG